MFARNVGLFNQHGDVMQPDPPPPEKKQVTIYTKLNVTNSLFVPVKPSEIDSAQ